LLKEERFAFDVELILALDRAGSKIEEIPIDWVDVSGSKVSLIRDSVNMFFALKKIKKRAKKWIF
jgi:dolichyl-phosphate beta-glucosyltransferase